MAQSRLKSCSLSWTSQKPSRRTAHRSTAMGDCSTTSGSPSCPSSRFGSETSGQPVASSQPRILIDQLAHADKEYVKFLDSHIGRRAKWLALDAHRDSVVMRVNRGQAMLKIGARMSA